MAAEMADSSIKIGGYRITALTPNKTRFKAMNKNIKKLREPAATKTTLVGYLLRGLPSINAKPPVNNSFAPFSGYTQQELEKIVRKIRKKTVNTPIYRKEIKSKPPQASPPPPFPPIRYSSADAIEMELQPGSGINGTPIYKPKIGD